MFCLSRKKKTLQRLLTLSKIMEDRTITYSRCYLTTMMSYMIIKYKHKSKHLNDNESKTKDLKLNIFKNSHIGLIEHR